MDNENKPHNGELTTLNEENHSSKAVKSDGHRWNASLEFILE